MDAGGRTDTLIARGGEPPSGSKLTICPALSPATSYANTAATSKWKRPPWSDWIAPDEPLRLNSVILPFTICSYRSLARAWHHVQTPLVHGIELPDQPVLARDAIGGTAEFVGEAGWRPIERRIPIPQAPQ